MSLSGDGEDRLETKQCSDCGRHLCGSSGRSLVSSEIHILR